MVLRRFRLPVPARVIERAGRPMRVTTGRRGLEGGEVEASAGPWRTSGEWWRVGSSAGELARSVTDAPAAIASSGNDSPPAASPERGHEVAESNGASPERGHEVAESKGWNRDEWDVALADGVVYRIYCDRVSERWFVEGIVD